MSWTDEFAEALDGLSLGRDETRVLLDLAREVAHRTERVNAPLSTYLAGRFASDRVRMGEDPAEAVREALRRADALLPPAGEHAGS